MEKRKYKYWIYFGSLTLSVVLTATIYSFKPSVYRPANLTPPGGVEHFGPYFGENKTPQSQERSPASTRFAGNIGNIGTSSLGTTGVTMVTADEVDTAKYHFPDIANVSSGTQCSKTDYSVIDNCYNYDLPPAPKYLHPTKVPGKTDPNTIAFPKGTSAQGKSQVLPFTRSSNDGRLVFTNGVEYGNPVFRMFRPEALDQDVKAKSAVPTLSSETGLHPLMYYNPTFTKFPKYLRDDGSLWMPHTYHQTTCDDSGMAFTPGQPNQVSSNRNPKKCKARYKNTDSYTEGDCYDISILMNMDSAGESPSTIKNPTTHWEMRSSDFTIFVSAPKTLNAGEPSNFGYQHSGMWIYPRQTINNSGGWWILPEYYDYDFPNTNWPGVLTDAQDLCYTKTGTKYDRKSGSPKWCEYFDHQHYSYSGFLVTDQGSANDPSTFHNTASIWTGDQCQNNAFGCKNLNLFEPSITADGKLLMMNVGGLRYSYNTLGACNAAGWSILKPVSMMPSDPNINTNYAIGKSMKKGTTYRNFRDSAGNEIYSGAHIEGAYGWLDREGKNIFFSQVNVFRDGYHMQGAYGTPSDGAPPYGSGDANLVADNSTGKSVTVFGAWTKGKMVPVDSVASLSDFGGRNNAFGSEPPQYEYDFAAYKDLTLKIRPLSVASIFSFENVFNYYSALSPTLPFDVVWRMHTSSQLNPEVEFDDYLNDRAFVIAHMNAPVPMTDDSEPKDGFVAGTTTSIMGMKSGYHFAENPLLLNAATTDSFFSSNGIVPPKTLRVRGGARIEPLAQGGIIGKGLYLDGINDFVDMGYPMNTSLKDWFMGIWTDNRESNSSIVRTLFYFPDNSYIGVSKNNLVLYDSQEPNPALKQRTLDIHAMINGDSWNHFGFKITTLASKRWVQVYINGTLVKFPTGSQISFSIPDINNTDTYGFQLMKSTGTGWSWFVVGDPGFSFSPRAPFKGWIDDLKIYSLSDSDRYSSYYEEIACNHALGTLVDVSKFDEEANSGGGGWNGGGIGAKLPNIGPIKSQLEKLRTLATNYGYTIPDHLSYPNSSSDSSSDSKSRAPASIGSGIKLTVPKVITRLPICEQLKFESYSTPTTLPSQDNRGSICIDKFHKNSSSDPVSAQRCVRKTYLGIDNLPLQANTRRPDFSHTGFCLSCHTNDNALKSLKVDALTLDTTHDRFEDPRRQPLNVPATIHGLTPDRMPSAAVTVSKPCPSDGTNGDCLIMDTVFDFKGKIDP